MKVCGRTVNGLSRGERIARDIANDLFKDMGRNLNLRPDRACGAFGSEFPA